ncbi:Retroelement pol Polyprotein [Phytophthora cinnamomi]|uniref:Retroelement pol Polyprotein n=1 Tax=Phytophthora cinnamomi TaxID=4785 RepID=UPI00355AC355|nr:Retroelement pol Polyprotein [Phytophthora cinnamomi]
MMSTTASTVTTKLKQFSGTGFPPAWGAQVNLVLEIKGLWDAIQMLMPTEHELKLERDAAVAVGAGRSLASGTPSSSGTTPGTEAGEVPAVPFATQLHDRMIKQKMAASIILAALSEKFTAEVYLLDHPLTMLRHLRMTYNVKCSASVGAAKHDYIGLYLDGDASMINHIQNTRRVLDELQVQHVVISDDEKRQNFMQSMRPAWNGFVGVLESCGTFEMMVQRCQAEAIRREQQKHRRAFGDRQLPSPLLHSALSKRLENRKRSSQKQDMGKVKCFNCGQMGHFARNYKYERAHPKAEAASMAFTVDDVFNENKRTWIVGSGATSHMTDHLDNLTDVSTLAEPRVLTVASGDSLAATAIGQAPLLKNGREVCELQEVLLVKGLARNLVSLAAASRRGMTVEFKDTSCMIRSPNMVLRCWRLGKIRQSTWWKQ